MAFSRYDPRARYRSRQQQRLGAGFGLFLIAVLVGTLGWGLGRQAAQGQIASLKAELTTLMDERDRLRSAATQLMADTHSSSVKYQQIEEKLQTELPDNGALAGIVTQLKDQLAAGIPADRLAQVIRSMAPPKNCSEPDIKRFVVQTPKNKAPAVGTPLASGDVTLRVAGVSARDKQGRDETWYDPGQPVEVTFEWKGVDGDRQTLTRRNVLPVSQILSGQGKEYRLTLAPGARSFVKVTYDMCDGM